MTALVERPGARKRARGFGGRPAETDRWQHRHRAAGRPHTFRYASRKYWDKISYDLKPIYTAPSAADARRAYDEFAEKWGRAYPAIKTLWDNAWAEYIGVPRLRRRDPQGPLLDERDREPERPLPPSRPGSRALPERAVRDEDLVLGDEESGPEGHRADTMGHALEASPERLRHHLRRPHASSSGPLRCQPPLTPFIGQSPAECSGT